MHNISLKDYAKVVGEEKINEIYQAAKPLEGKSIIHMNSTYNGGGVAEMLNTLILLFNDIGISCGWRLLKGTPSFFNITKSFHNMLQGDPMDLEEDQKTLYESVVYNNSIFNHWDKHDVVIVHDPQPLPSIRFFKKGQNQPWIWRCHIDITKPNQRAWEYLKQFISEYDEIIVSDEKYFKKDIDAPQTIIHPSIDPLNDKNRDLSDEETRKLLSEMNIPTGKPIISQVSRYDIWKDPIGVLEVFKKIKKEVDCHLVLLGNVADDDPESITIYEQVAERAKNMTDVQLIVNVKNNDLAVNALQKASAVVLQKSTKEGFALTVSEALWKRTPVIASRVGGIPLQIIEGKNGFLIDDAYDYDEFAKKAIYLLENKEEAKAMGEFGREYVRENFLVTRHLLDYIVLLKRVLKL
ncbi:glycosyltransferase [Patescibacteria group bacterium]|nr:glycosyltransferase [Patescibacteria group bacterium]